MGARAGRIIAAARAGAAGLWAALWALPARAQEAAGQAGEAVGRAAEEGVKTLPQATDMTGAWLQMAGMLCLLVAVMLVGFWALRRFGRRAGLGLFGSGELKIEGTMGLGPKKSIVVVRFLNKRLVLGVTDASINLLTELDTDDDDARKDFGKTLDQARAKDGAS